MQDEVRNFMCDCKSLASWRVGGIDADETGIVSVIAFYLSRDIAFEPCEQYYKSKSVSKSVNINRSRLRKARYGLC